MHILKLFSDDGNLHIAVQYTAIMDDTKIKHDAAYGGMEGRVGTNGTDMFFRKKRSRKYMYRATLRVSPNPAPEVTRAGGNCFEIQLERDVKLPVKYIHSTLPDGGDGHSAGSIYGMYGSAWTRGGIKTIHAPVKLAV